MILGEQGSKRQSASRKRSLNESVESDNPYDFKSVSISEPIRGKKALIRCNRSFICSALCILVISLIVMAGAIIKLHIDNLSLNDQIESKDQEYERMEKQHQDITLWYKESLNETNFIVQMNETFNSQPNFNKYYQDNINTTLLRNYWEDPLTKGILGGPINQPLLLKVGDKMQHI